MSGKQHARLRVQRRGEVWRNPEGHLFLVVSADDFNRTRMREVICLGVLPGDLAADDPSPYGYVIRVDGSLWTIFGDDLQVISKTSLTDLAFMLPGALMDALANVFREIVTPGAPCGVLRPSLESAGRKPP